MVNDLSPTRLRSPSHESDGPLGHGNASSLKLGNDRAKGGHSACAASRTPSEALKWEDACCHPCSCGLRSEPRNSFETRNPWGETRKDFFRETRNSVAKPGIPARLRNPECLGRGCDTRNSWAAKPGISGEDFPTPETRPQPWKRDAALRPGSPGALPWKRSDSTLETGTP